ncbi:MAG: hypothetical protein ACKOU6_00420, partial [Planctomycetota bacterium]
ASVGWPSWLPIRINEIGLEWADVQNRPQEFVLTLSASVTGIKGVSGAEFSGSLDGIKIDVNKLLRGEFPILDIASLSVGMKANVFGGKLTATLLGGILKIDSSGQIIPPTAPANTPVQDRVFFIGFEGGFAMAGLSGFTLRFAMSELGPLGVLVTASLPTGILLEPISGLSINDFVGGVEFFTTLPDINNPDELRRPEFSPAGRTNSADWLPQVKQQVLNQYRAIKTNPNRAGFTAAFTSPMLITGGATLYTTYTSKQTFNGQIELKFATDGKIALIGRLNFANNNLSISARLYANLSKIKEGSAKVLFLADVPDQVQLLIIKGKFQMGFNGADGKPVEFVTADPLTVPAANLSTPANKSEVGLSALNQRGYIDVVYRPSDGKMLDEASITDTMAEFSLQTSSGSAITSVTIKNDQVTKIDETTYRYPFSGQFTVGEIVVVFLAGGVADKGGKLNAASTQSFSIKQAMADLAAPQNDTKIDIRDVLNNRYLLVNYVPTPGAQLYLTSDNKRTFDPG